MRSRNSGRDAGRAVLVDRARVARDALWAARRSAQAGAATSAADRGRAGRALRSYSAAGTELHARDRLAREVCDGWLRAARAHLWFGDPEFARAEDLAYRFVCALADGHCPRTGPRRIRRAYESGLRLWYRDHGREIDAALRVVRGAVPPV